MKTLILATAASLFAAMPAFAQAPAPVPGSPGAAPQVQIFRTQKPMRTETRNEVVTHVRDMFARLDTNRDGFITREEADAADQKMAGDMREKFAKRLAERGTPMAPGATMASGSGFDRLDLNKDGVITRDEFNQARSTMNERRVIVMREGGPGAPGMPDMQGMKMRMHGMRLGGHMFETADANRDGRVSLQEMTDSALRHFDSADANHDGQLTPDERMQMRKFRIERHQPAR
jgi:Ca2+-binding EF-hand superfamily protein